VWCFRYVSGQTDKQTDTLIAILHTRAECRLSARWPPTLRPSQPTWTVREPIGSWRPHSSLPFIIITQSTGSVYRPTEDGRLIHECVNVAEHRVWDVLCICSDCCHLLLLFSPQAQFTVPLRTGGWYMSVWMLQSTVYGMGFAFALIVAKKRKMLGDPGTVQPGLCRVFIWITGFLSIAGLVVSMIQQCTV